MKRIFYIFAELFEELKLLLAIHVALEALEVPDSATIESLVKQKSQLEDALQRFVAALSVDRSELTDDERDGVSNTMEHAHMRLKDLEEHITSMKDLEEKQLTDMRMKNKRKMDDGGGECFWKDGACT
jgi:hypothetical protein